MSDDRAPTDEQMRAAIAQIPDDWLGYQAGFFDGLMWALYNAPKIQAMAAVCADGAASYSAIVERLGAFAANAQATAQEHTGTTIAEVMIDPDRHGMPELVANLEVPGMSFEAVSIGEMGALLQSMLGGGHDA